MRNILKYTLAAALSLSLAGYAAAEENKIDNMPSKIAADNIKTIKYDYKKFNGLNMQEDNIKIIIDGKRLDLKLPTYIDKNRYYIPLTEIAEKLNGEIDENDNLILIKILNTQGKIDLKEKKITSIINKEFKLKENIIVKDDVYYISFIDFSNMMNLYARWDSETKTIKTHVIRDLPKVKQYTPKLVTMGFLRLEDVTCSRPIGNDDSYEKLRIEAKFLSDRKIAYHVAWVPRYVDPKNNIDIDPSRQNGFSLADFIYTLDCISYNGGEIGLHGYTHQMNDEMSLIGYEFGKDAPDVNRLRERVGAALKLARDVDIDVNFFETPHYSITQDQDLALENYFKYIYHETKPNSTKIRRTYMNRNYYIPTPLSYVIPNEENLMADKIKNYPSDKIASLFFHPFIDFNSIKLTETDRIPGFQYDDASPLKKVTNALEEKGYRMSYVTDIH